MRGLAALGIGLSMACLFASTALAQSAPPITINASGGWDVSTGKPDSCSTTEWLFVINGVSPSGNAPSSITVVFDVDGTPTAADVTLTFTQTFLNPPETTAHYSIPMDATNAAYVLDGASAQLPAGTTYNNFVLSHGSCAGSTTTTPGGPGGGGPPPPVGATPELDSLVLFGTGALGLGSYALTRVRARRRRIADEEEQAEVNATS